MKSRDELRGAKATSLALQRHKGAQGPERARSQRPRGLPCASCAAPLCIALPHIRAFSVTSLQHSRGSHSRDQLGSNRDTFGLVPREGLGWLLWGQMPNPAGARAKLYRYGNRSQEGRRVVKRVIASWAGAPKKCLPANNHLFHCASQLCVLCY